MTSRSFFLGAILICVLFAAVLFSCGDTNDDDEAFHDSDDDDNDSTDDDESIWDDDDDNDDDDTCQPLFPNVLITAHRGAMQLAPGNTLPAFEAAFEHGAEIVEADVRHTADGQYVLMHNESVDSTTNGSGLVAEMTLAQIKQLLVDDSAYGNIHGDLRVPTLAEALLLVDSHDGQMYVDMKTDQVEGAVQVIVDLGLEHRGFIYSGDLNEHKRVRAVSLDVRIMPSSTFMLATRYLFWHFEPDPEIVDVHDLGFSRANIELIHSLGSTVAMDALGIPDDLGAQGNTWGWRRMMEFGVDIIQTDYALEMVAFRNSLCR
jgi:glycerophosphoryl diester phosphodiesterase